MGKTGPGRGGSRFNGSTAKAVIAASVGRGARSALHLDPRADGGERPGCGFEGVVGGEFDAGNSAAFALL
jgi:hypothetical protein